MEYVLVGGCSLLAVVFGVPAGSKLRSRQAYAEFVAATALLTGFTAAIVLAIRRGERAPCSRWSRVRWSRYS